MRVTRWESCSCAGKAAAPAPARELAAHLAALMPSGGAPAPALDGTCLEAIQADVIPCKPENICLVAGEAAAPAFTADAASGRRVWRLLMPAGGPPAACPPGTGEGEFQPLGSPCTVVRAYIRTKSSAGSPAACLPSTSKGMFKPRH